MRTVGNHLAVHLAQENSDNLLAEPQQFEAYGRLTAFLMHDLKNLIAQQSPIIRNAEKHNRNPEFVDDAMQTIANSVDRMKHVMDQIRRGEADRLAKATELKFIVSTAVDQRAGKEPVLTLDLNDVNVSLEVDVEQFTMVLTHLIQNTQDATPAGEGLLQPS